MQIDWNVVSGYIIKYGMNLLTAALIFIIGKWAAHAVAGMSEQAMTRAKVNVTLASFAKNIVYYGVLIFVFLAALNQLGIQTSSFVALVGAAGLAIGLALQGALANFAAGVMIILFQPFEVGDKIEAGGAVGRVTEIQIFNTIMVSSDNLKTIVPNAKITGDKIVVHPRT